MGYFGYYFICLTVVYIIYYTVVIAMDVHGYGKKKSARDVEEISTKDMFDDHDAVFVSETDDGFDVSSSLMPVDDMRVDDSLDDLDLGASGSGDGDGGASYARHYGDGYSVESPVASPSDDDGNDDDVDDVAEAQRALERAMEARDNGLIDTTVLLEEDYSSEEFDVLVSQPLNVQRRFLMEVLR